MVRSKSIRAISPLSILCVICCTPFLTPTVHAQEASRSVEAHLLEHPGATKFIDADLILSPLEGGASTTKVIVNLARPDELRAATDFTDIDSLRELQAEIATRQEAVLDALTEEEFRLRYRMENQVDFSGEVTQHGIEKLLCDPRVVSIEPVRILKVHGSQAIPLINGMAYRTDYNGEGVSIAICDTGVDYTHPRLGGGAIPNGKVIGGYDICEDDSDPAPVGNAHGTCCAGIAAGDLGTVGDYIGGVAPGAKLYALKITPDGSDEACSDAITDAWNWCVTHRADNSDYPIAVISTSFAGGRHTGSCNGSSPSTTTASENANAAEITVLASSGNDGYCDAIAFPACISNVIAIGAVYDANIGQSPPPGYVGCISDESCVGYTVNCPCAERCYVDQTTAADQVATYSNSAASLDVFAPSNKAYTTDIVGTDGENNSPSPAGDYYDSFGGTSAACPYAAGAVAALQSAAKDLYGESLLPDEIRSVLVSTGDSVTDSKAGITKPRVNLGAAIDQLREASEGYHQPYCVNQHGNEYSYIDPDGDWEPRGDHGIRMSRYGGDCTVWYHLVLPHPPTGENYEQYARSGSVKVGVQFLDWAGFPYWYLGPEFSIYDYVADEYVRFCENCGTQDSLEWKWWTFNDSNRYISDDGDVYLKIYVQGARDTVVDDVRVQFEAADESIASVNVTATSDDCGGDGQADSLDLAIDANVGSLGDGSMVDIRTAVELRAPGGGLVDTDQGIWTIIDCQPDPVTLSLSACGHDEGGVYDVQVRLYDEAGNLEDETELEVSLYPPGAVEGACCFANGSCSIATASECTSASGTWWGAGTDCDPNPCPQPSGACCFSDGSCAPEYAEGACGSAGGTWQGAESDCSPNPCPMPVGACCLSGGVCADDYTQAGCAAAAGVWLGPETDCDPNPCEEPIGACCMPCGACAEYTESGCIAAGGAWEGEGSSCSDRNPCPQPGGACCFGDGSCEVYVETDCTSLGGGWRGAATDCDPNPCWQPPEGACCSADGTCTEVQGAGNCAGVYQGDGVLCAMVTCPVCGNSVVEDGEDCDPPNGVNCDANCQHAATVIVVAPDGSGTFPTIQAAVDAAMDGDIIELADGTFIGGGNRNVDFLGKAITVRAQNSDPAGCVIDCMGLARGFIFENGEGADSVLQGVTIKNGHADSGGALYCDYSSPTISGCVIAYNSADLEGGGLFSNASAPTLVNCLLHHNHSDSMGGAIHAYGMSPTLVNCTIVNNSADSQGGGLWLGNSSPALTNCIVWGNAPGQIHTYRAATASFCDIQGGFAGEGNIDADPLFVDALNDDYHLADGSPCINAGQYGIGGLSDYDFEGNDRVQHCRVDMGCDETVFIGLDCNDNGEADACDLADCDGSDWCSDCNGNHVPDDCDVDPTDPDGNGEVSADCSVNGIPDECEPDCNDNGEADSCDIFYGSSQDCNGDGVPDECNLADCGSSLWCRDCNSNDVPDACDIDAGTSLDCNANGIPDECDLADCDGSPWCSDCNGTGVPDECDIATGTSEDCTDNGIPDECEPDCNDNGEADSCDIDAGTSLDCNSNDIPDECDLADCGGSAWCSDCNTNGIPDACDISSGFSEDCNANGSPDECEPGGTADCNTNGEPDMCDIYTGYSEDCNSNVVPDECDVDPLDPDGDGEVSDDLNVNGIPDECETDCNENGILDEFELITESVFDSSTSWGAFRPSSHGVGDHQGYTGAVYDGRYVYFAPYGDPNTPHGEVLRYDTTMSLGAPSAWAAYEYGEHCGEDCSDPRGYKGCVFDGSYVYFAPFHNGGGQHCEFLRYDTSSPSFNSPSAWTAFNVCDAAGLGTPGGYHRGVYDDVHGYIYFAPISTDKVLRYNTSMSFTNTSAWQQCYQTHAAPNVHFYDIDFDGAYVYLLPGTRDVVRFDTSEDFTDSSAWSVYNPTGEEEFYGGIYVDGYLYLAPVGDPDLSQAVRYDTSAPFEAPSSWDSYDITDSGGGAWSGSTVFHDAATDDSHVYFVPYNGGAVLRYDPSQPFTSAVAWESYQYGPVGFEGAASSGSHIFFSPGGTQGTVLRYNLLANDCNANGVLDECEQGGDQDCNGNGAPDICDIDCARSVDCNGNGIPDECEPGGDQDCDGDSSSDLCELFLGTGHDCNDNGVPDDCDIASGASEDCQPNGIPDDCEAGPGSPGFDDPASWLAYMQGGRGTQAIHDGQYIYIVPGENGTARRYDRFAPFDAPASWVEFDACAALGIDGDYWGGVHAKHFIYFVPSEHGEVLQYDILLDFTDPASWRVFDAEEAFGTITSQFRGGAFDAEGDHGYVYFASHDATEHMLRYNTASTFTSAASWQTSDVLTDGVHGYRDAACDGQYVYFVPAFPEGSPVVRYDTVQGFNDPAAWSSGPALTGNQYSAVVFDGQFLYFSPDGNVGSGEVDPVLRYDTSSEFTSPGSWETFDYSQLGDGAWTVTYEYRDVILDRNYVYFIPFRDASYHSDGAVLRYDRNGDFDAPSSWSFYDYADSDSCASDPGCSNPTGYSAAVSDGRYIYLVPAENNPGEFLRYDVRSGDCNGNGVPDECDIRDGFSDDLNDNWIPDECDVDCNDNGVSDLLDLSGCDGSPWCDDCNDNGVPDECDIASGACTDCNLNGVPDECDLVAGTSADCNDNGTPDECDVASGASEDCQPNGIPDECETDCNGNGTPDDCDLVAGTSLDCQPNGIPDECESDCNENGVPDDCDIAAGTSDDCQPDGIPDECELGADMGVGFSNPDSWLSYYSYGGTRTGAVLAGQYVYFTPYSGGKIVRYDTSAPFDEQASWSLFDACAEIGAHGGYWGAVFDGQYMYCSPYPHGEVLRYDTTEAFTAPGSWETFSAEAAFGSGAAGYINGAFDGVHGYVYFSPVGGQMLRYNTAGEFANPSSWEISSAVTGSYPDAVFDGQYVYFVPHNDDALRFDTSGSFTDPESWTIYDGVTDNYWGATSDGRYVYFSPEGSYGSQEISPALRYDTWGEFTSAASWESFDYSQLGSGPWEGTYVYRDVISYANYVYFVPHIGATGAYSGEVLRYDRNRPFGSVAAWRTYNYAESDACAADPGCSNPAGYNAAVCDGRYIFFAPSGGTDEMLRHTLRTGLGDCNENGVPDDCDIQDGFSEDLNGNDVPDECEDDCNTNGTFDYLDLAACDGSPWCSDCNSNGVPDECDISDGTSDDSNVNGIPDECEVDCNTNGIFDYQDLVDCDGSLWCSDCNDNGILDVCDIDGPTSTDIDGNGEPDECDADCNENGVPDACDVDCGTGDCTIHPLGCGTSADCQPNDLPDECDIAAGTSSDVDEDGTPDECQPDCNDNGLPDDWEIAQGTSQDCQPNGVPDECDIAEATSDDYDSDGVPDECSADCNANGIPDACDLECATGSCATHPLGCGASADCQVNGVPDECDLTLGTSLDCQPNDVPDECDIAFGTSSDCDLNEIPDECDIANCDGDPACEDCNGNDIPDGCDITLGTSEDCQPNEVPDECDIAEGTSEDVDEDGTPDECELPCIGYAPGELINVGDEGYDAPAQSLEIWNCNIGTLSYEITDDVEWLDCQPSSGTSTGEVDTITCAYTTGALEPGEYGATVTISDPAAENTPQTVSVSLTVNECESRRNLSVWRSCYSPEVPKPVFITLTPSAGASAFALEDRPPTGWTISNISDGGYWDAVYQKVKWGPFFEPFPEEVSYEVTAPGETTGEYCFTGTASVDGVNTQTCGDDCIEECSTCPPIAADAPQPMCSGCGDCSCAGCEDFRIEMCEMIGYACAWQKGCNDDLPGMTRAAYLWMSGEYYCWDEVEFNWYPTSYPPPATGCCDGRGGGHDRSGLTPGQIDHACTAICMLPSHESTIAAQNELEVHIVMDAPEGSLAAAVELVLPSDWQVISISDVGEWDDVNGKVKWGPFLNDLSRSVTVTVRPLTHAADPAKFWGTVSIDGISRDICMERQ